MKKRKKKQDARRSERQAVAPLAVTTGWRDAIFVCNRCAGKLDGRMGDKGRSLVRGEIRDALKQRGARRDVKVMETGCFGLCPKGGQVIATASGLSRGTLYVFDGADAGAVIVDSLLPGAEPASLTPATAASPR